MERKVSLFDVNDAKIGKTFMRRARQLVIQQRAEWIDDSHSGIRFIPEADEPGDASLTAIIDEHDDDMRIYAIAEKRIRERKMFILHSIAFITGYIIIFALCLGFNNIRFFPAKEFFWFVVGSWTTAYAIHAYYFTRHNLKGFLHIDKAERREQRIAEEVDKLKRMRYLDKA